MILWIPQLAICCHLCASRCRFAYNFARILLYVGYCRILPNLHKHIQLVILLTGKIIKRYLFDQLYLCYFFLFYWAIQPLKVSQFVVMKTSTILISHIYYTVVSTHRRGHPTKHDNLVKFCCMILIQLLIVHTGTTRIILFDITINLTVCLIGIET